MQKSTCEFVDGTIKVDRVHHVLKVRHGRFYEFIAESLLELRSS